MVTLTTGDGQLPETAVLANLATQVWDAKYSFYTLDRNGERLIVKSSGGKAKCGTWAANPYRTWSGQGNIFEDTPVAFAFKGDAEEQISCRNDLGDDLESNFEDISIQGSDSFREDDNLSTIAEESGLENEAQQGSEYQGPITRSIFQKNPANHGRLLHLTTNGDDGHKRRPKEALGDGLRSPLGSIIDPIDPSPSESTSAAPKISAVSAGKRPARDAIDEDRSPKRAYLVSATTPVDSSTAVRSPRTLTAYKQERTVLYVMLPGSTSDMVPVKLRSAMTMSAMFSSVSVAAGVLDEEHMAIAVRLGGEYGGQARSLIVKKNLMDTFEVFLEMVDGASCWGEEEGSLTLQLELR